MRQLKGFEWEKIFRFITLLFLSVHCTLLNEFSTFLYYQSAWLTITLWVHLSVYILPINERTFHAFSMWISTKEIYWFIIIIETWTYPHQSFDRPAFSISKSLDILLISDEFYTSQLCNAMVKWSFSHNENLTSSTAVNLGLYYN
jgi:hypothetical protein